MLKNWCFWTVVLEKTLESPLDCKESQRVYPKRYQSWIFIGRTDVEAETPMLWPPDVKNWLIWKDPDDGKIEGRLRRGGRRWDGWIASSTQWTWVWVNSGIWWWIGKPGMLWSMGMQRAGHHWVTELICTELHLIGYTFPFLPWFSFLFFVQLFVKPPQTTTLPSCVSFSLGWFCSLPPVQYYEPLSIVLQALCLPDLIP